MIRLCGFSGLVDFTFVYMGVIFGLYLLIRGWNFYNSKKFRGKERRLSHKAVSAHDLENFFKLEPQTIDRVREWKDITFEFEEKNQIFLKESKDSKNTQRYQGHFRPT